jgi:hypothetical protein
VAVFGEVLVGVWACVDVGVWEGSVGSLVREGPGLVVDTFGVGDGGRGVRVGRRVGVHLGVGDEAVRDARGVDAAVSVADTASATAAAEVSFGSAVLEEGAHAASINSSMYHATRRLREALCLTSRTSGIDV